MKYRLKRNRAKYREKLKNNDAGCDLEEYTPAQWENFDDAVYKHEGGHSEMLFGNFIKKGGIHLIGGPKSSGKTIVVTTIAEGISSGKACSSWVEGKNVRQVVKRDKKCLYMTSKWRRMH